jgi:hypothetical protein
MVVSSFGQCQINPRGAQWIPDGINSCSDVRKKDGGPKPAVERVLSQ